MIDAESSILCRVSASLSVVVNMLDSFGPGRPVPVRIGSGAGPCGSRLEPERTRHRVVIAKIDVEPRRLGGVLRRLPDVGRGSRNRREDGVVQRSWLAGRALK